MDTAAQPPAAHQRHWPLDLPSGLPFERYEHRRLTARDILVHRIMAALFAPTNNLSTGLSAALAAPRQPPSRINVARTYDARLQSHSTKMGVSIPYHNFAGLKMADRELARDVEVLRKMLVTRSASEWVQQELVKPAKAIAAYPEVRPPVTSFWDRERPAPPKLEERPSVEEEVLELVRMHYMEVDDPATRVWLGMVDAPRRSGYKTLPKMTAKQGSHKELVHKRVAWRECNEAEDYKRWYPEETAHLKTLQSQTRVANERPLYEGGAFLPRLQRKLLASKVARAKYLNNMMEVRKQSYFADEHNGREIQDEVYPWPEPDAPRRVLHAPSVYSWRQKQHFFRNEMPPVDFASGRTGRGLDRDGIWATGRWYGDDVPRGRITRRRRRRAASEPPPGTFMAARLPVSFNSSRELLIFRKMSLSTLERRTRRRSLSRTRIAEMFNWDITLENPAPKPHVQPQFMGLLASPPKNLARRLNHLDAIKHATTEFEKCTALFTELYHQFGQGQRSVHPVTEIPWVATYAADRDALPCSKLMVDVDGGEHLTLKEKRNDHGDIEVNLYPRNPSPVSPAPSCTNCTSTDHQTKQCRLPCGFCGAPNPNLDYKHVDVARGILWFFSGDEEHDISKAGKHDNPHLAHNCPVARTNRCKCTPFPQFHAAAHCLVLCSRPCGNTAYLPGHFKHRTAMACTSRCCMCGMRGHSGTKCKYRTCRCGGSHLGQDCAWHPACRVVGCHRFHCGVHCRVCGLDRGQAGVVLVGGLCPACVGEEDKGTSVSAHADADAAVGEKGKGRTRRNRRSSRSDPKKTKEAKTWYAPLEPRTRPVVGAKSGKNAARRDGIDGEAVVKIGGCR